MPTWQWQLLRAGTFHLDGGAMFGILPKPMWARMCDADLQNRVQLQTNCLLLTGEDGAKVLVEAGFGNKWAPKEVEIYGLEHRWIADALAEIGVGREEIDAVILTHLHFDHAGGVTFIERGHDQTDTGARPGDIASPQVTFPNATIYVQQQEWDDALANRSTMTRTYLREHLDPIADQVRTVQGEAEVLPGIRVLPVPGHTWGQQAILFNDAEGGLIFPGDVMPTVWHAHPASSMAYDMLPYENMLTKQRLFELCLEQDLRWVLDHEPGNPVVRIARDEKRPDRFEVFPVVDAADDAG
ncbi:MAG: MBL fold metallo-hydrolase [Planctomycetota bacterium]